MAARAVSASFLCVRTQGAPARAVSASFLCLILNAPCGWVRMLNVVHQNDSSSIRSYCSMLGIKMGRLDREEQHRAPREAEHPHRWPVPTSRLTGGILVVVVACRRQQLGRLLVQQLLREREGRADGAGSRRLAQPRQHVLHEQHVAVSLEHANSHTLLSRG